jgi:predicted amidohydrolase YtcJ
MLRPAAILSALLLAACTQPSPTPPAADATEPTEADRPSASRIFSSGTIYTGVGDETVDTVAVDDDGRIVWTGSVDDLDAEVDIENAEFVWLNNNFMYPGFTDAHAHLNGIGERELQLDLASVKSIAELLEVVAAENDAKPGDGLLFGRGWLETGWPEGRMPTAADLDSVVADRPVILIRADGHALVANSAALAAVGIDADTADTEGGKIERDEDGKATGILIDEAMNLTLPLYKAPDADAVRESYIVGAAEYASRGWTGIHNMSVPPEDASLLAELDAESLVPLRLWNAFSGRPEQAEMSRDIASNRKYETDTITNRAIKYYMDGALGSRGALLIEPYSDRPDTSGLSLLSPEELKEAMSDADAGGYQLAIHAIGDLGNRRLIDGAIEGGYDASHRWRIEHTQLLNPADIPRMAESGLIASMQPSHAIGDLHFAPARVGLGRLQGAYAWQSLMDAGVLVAGGSDAPVEVGSPLIEFYAAVARKDLTGFTGEGWHPEEAVSREEALALFTSNAAYAAFMEDDLGTIEPGKIADFSVFDRDLMSVPEAEILDANAVMTVVGGEIVWSAAE